jgi:hypothetical protein
VIVLSVCLCLGVLENHIWNQFFEGGIGVYIHVLEAGIVKRLHEAWYSLSSGPVDDGIGDAALQKSICVS